ncbi:MAG: hypothetical protein ACLUD2_00710 [Clostridium sp.]
MHEADLIVYVVDGSTASWTKTTPRSLELIRDRKAVVLLNKTDLDRDHDKERARRKKRNIGDCAVSAKRPAGTGRIVRTGHSIQDRFYAGKLTFNDESHDHQCAA